MCVVGGGGGRQLAEAMVGPVTNLIRITDHCMHDIRKWPITFNNIIIVLQTDHRKLLVMLSRPVIGS